MNSPMLSSLTSPMFAACHPLMQELAENVAGPELEAYNGLAIAKNLLSGGGRQIRFVPKAKCSTLKYEAKIFLMGEVETRETEKHDLFNAWVWLTFPKAKAVINLRHYEALTQRNVTRQRSSIEDALTLLDENGVIVLCSDPGLAELLGNFEWKTLFWRRRTAVTSSIRVFLFGHGLLEKALQPYVGMSAHSLIFGVEPSFFELPLKDQLNMADGLLAAYLIEKQNEFNSSDLSPLPVLGVPGFFADNNQEIFYDNSQYFRAKIRRSPRASNL